jgi:hypothetical protein
VSGCYDGDVDADALREVINGALQAEGLTAREASLKAGLNQNLLSKFLRGETSELASRSCILLAPVLKLDEDHLLEMAGHRTPRSVDDPVGHLRSAALRGPWSLAVGQAFAGLATAVAEERRAWEERWRNALEEVLAEPVGAAGKGLSKEEYARWVIARARERVDAS